MRRQLTMCWEFQLTIVAQPVLVATATCSASASHLGLTSDANVNKGRGPDCAMSAKYRYVADPGEPDEVRAWFRALPSPPEEIEGEAWQRYWLVFRAEGPLARTPEGGIDPVRSPLVCVYPPRVRRGVLWTVGEVHFVATPLRQLFPSLQKISAAFARWLGGHDCVFSNKPGFHASWNYYLQGSVQNYDPPIFALPSGLRALKEGRHFVGDDDNEAYLDDICAMLRSRGVVCTDRDA
jgi:hypothetical protein